MLVMNLLLISLVSALAAVASHPSPHFGALGLVVAAAVGCWVLVLNGGLFLSLVLFLIYLGGMLVVFVYSTALAAEPYPKSLGHRSVLANVLSYIAVACLICVSLYETWFSDSWLVADEFDELAAARGDIEGVAMLYSFGGEMLLVGGYALFLALLAALELTRGVSRGAVRAL
uniref:NADH-ubiquinone oxidoreductase chain 6 n=1 Tax=Lobotes surinamensis TaxID=463596 RepID=A0A0B6VLU3_9TELE|nr:NADH dehydrogenase subunit 6 [Lobotes surinamensis]BAQ20849.1 NADH dehydrogenase subunit 6 [Lobotes surinamensis]